jgi:hypothetical protein
MNVFKKGDTLYEKGLQYTKVGFLKYNENIKAILNVTYLNSIDTKQWDNKDNHNFLIGIYIIDDNEDDSKKYLNNSQYKLTLNGENYISSEEFSDDYLISKDMPLKNPWAKYYLVKFRKDNKKSLNIEYINTNFGKVQLPFESE